MKTSTLLLLMPFIILSACNYQRPSDIADSIKKETIATDTNVYTVLPLDTNMYDFKGTLPLQLTDKDLLVVDEILKKCIVDNNIKQDTTKHYSNYIDLEKYKRQYVPFINKKGEHKVYVNCFYGEGFKGWKEELIHVNDGGKYFFHATINLTKHTSEDFQINGVA